MKSTNVSFLAGLLVLAITGAAQAALIDRGGGFIYDDVLDITWTQSANLSGQNAWATQLTWASALSIFDPVRGVVWSDWRLAKVDVNGDDTIVDCATASEAACRDNEYGYLFHQYGIRAGAPGPFTDVQSSYYWSGNEFRPNTFAAWVFFFFGGGTQAGGDKTTDYYAWAVRDGDVAAVDIDGDGVSDDIDNCTLAPNASQLDSNGDGIGNACDPDLDDNGVVNFVDASIFGTLFGTGTGIGDFNGDGNTNFIDYAIFPEYFGGPPGPSAD